MKRSRYILAYIHTQCTLECLSASLRVLVYLHVRTRWPIRSSRLVGPTFILITPVSPNPVSSITAYRVTCHSPPEEQTNRTGQFHYSCNHSHIETASFCRSIRLLELSLRAPVEAGCCVRLVLHRFLVDAVSTCFAFPRQPLYCRLPGQFAIYSCPLTGLKSLLIQFAFHSF